MLPLWPLTKIIKADPTWFSRNPMKGEQKSAESFPIIGVLPKWISNTHA
jgi:hypothetical protein